MAFRIKNGRLGRIIKSSGSSFLLKGVSFICSFILTKLIIGSYGSETNGMINSISQFLGMIMLIEGGIGGIARAALYKPLAQKNKEQINKILKYIQHFFRLIAIIFAAYAIVISFIFPLFSKEHSFWFTFTLVLIISLTYFFEYCFGITYSILLNADQRNYISNIFSFVYVVATFIASVILINWGLSIHVVKLVCAGLLISKPIILNVYCKHKYKLRRIKLDKKENMLPLKWDGFAVHIAYYLHRNTDVFLITLFLTFVDVSIYSIYNMIISGVLVIMGSFSLGFEAALGDIHASGDTDKLRKTFDLYSYWYSAISTLVFICTMMLIIPFVNIYTFGIVDANYNQPLLALLLVAAEYFYCLRVPYNDLMVATNSFKKIRYGAIFETIINISISSILIFLIGLPGVAVGTLLAMIFRNVHFLYFFKKSCINLKVCPFIKRLIVNISCFVVAYFMFPLLNLPVVNSYLSWIITALICCVFTFILIFTAHCVFLKKDIDKLFKYFKR